MSLCGCRAKVSAVLWGSHFEKIREGKWREVMPAGCLVAGSSRVQGEIMCWVGDGRKGPPWKGRMEEAVFEMSREGTPELDGVGSELPESRGVGPDVQLGLCAPW